MNAINIQACYICSEESTIYEKKKEIEKFQFAYNLNMDKKQVIF